MLSGKCGSSVHKALLDGHEIECKPKSSPPRNIEPQDGAKKRKLEPQEEPVTKKEKKEESTTIAPSPISLEQKKNTSVVASKPNTLSSNTSTHSTPLEKKPPTLTSNNGFALFSSSTNSTVSKEGILKHFEDESWWKILEPEFKKPYFKKIITFLNEEKEKGKVIYPPEIEIFNAFNLCPFDQVKVVIIGQDPYHGPGQAQGLCFSVRKGVTVPPSLKNIFKELSNDIPGFTVPSHGNLQGWAKQGVLLLNATLTVEARSPNSHAGIGWQTFTDAVIKNVSDRKSNIVFILWGAFAQKKAIGQLNSSKHCVLKAAHPSPYSADKFFGCKVFSKTNQYLKQHGIDEINWERVE